MSRRIFRAIGVGVLCLAAWAGFAHPPKSADLMETDVRQRRDLSLPLSRVVLNFFDFKSTNTAFQFSAAPNLPLHAAWLSTEKNDPSKKAASRFSRTVPELFTLYRTDGTDFEAAVTNSAVSLAAGFKTAWTPHALPYSAAYANGSVVVGEDFLADDRTVLRTLRFAGTPSAFYVAGRFAGTAEVRGDVVVIHNGHIRYAVAASAKGRFEVITPAKPLRTFGDPNVSEAAWGGVAAGVEPQERGWWFFRVDTDTLPDGELRFAAAFADECESDDSSMKASKVAVKGTRAAEARCAREAQWDRLLALVPEPRNTDLLKQVDAKGASSEGIRQAYYKAWVFTIQNVLPPDKKLYPYPQLAAGKPSLWDEGEARAPFSAAWESFLGIQFYAFVDPQVSWQAFKGLMSLVDADGMLGGESLPSRKAQTAMILYQLTHDKRALAETYPALCRYLTWRMKITHWIYGDYTPDPDWKDAEFAFSAIIDMEHVADIADILGKPEDAAQWRSKRAAFFEQAKTWFWKTPATQPVQNWHRTKTPRDQDNTVWVTTALYMDGLLRGDYLASTVARFDRDYDPNANFAGFFMPKYPDMSYSVYGLLKHGLTGRARGTMEAAVRDIVRAGAPFAEQYVGDDFRADGVRPSLFGSSMILDFTLLMNGYKYDRGAPAAVITASRQEGGVSGLLLRGRRYDLELGRSVRFGRQGQTLRAYPAQAGQIVPLEAE